jgi:hypothetical protein
VNRFHFRVARWVLPLSLALALARCDSGGDSSDGKSSWLSQCETNDDCDTPSACHCGLCTLGCRTASDCVGFSTASTCVDAVEGTGTDCRVGVTAASGICLPGCSKDVECPGPDGALRCESGVCIPTARTTSDAGGAGASDGGGDGSGGSRNAGGSVSTSGGDTADAASGGVAPTESDSGGVVPEPAPTRNAYGGPVSVPGDFPGTCDGGPILSTIETGACLSFDQCKHACETDNECPVVAGGSAVPVCGTGKYCELSCEGALQCATGMVCIESPSGTRRCVWPTQIPCRPGTPPPCSIRPRPAGCTPDSCAEEGVACDATLAVECCAGLVCTSEHYCSKEAP